MSKAVKPTRPRKAAAVSLRAGRPQGGHSADRRDRLLDTALDLFASQGIAATSLQAIAHEAQVTPALVHYYFGNKEQLLAAIIEERLMPLVQQFTSLLDMNSDEPLATILAITRGMADITAAHPWLSPLWVREVLSEGGLLRDWIQEHVAKGISEKISQLTRAAQQKKLLNPALDPRLMVIVMIGLTMFPQASQTIWRNLPGNEDISNDAMIAHMLEILAHGIEVKDNA